MLEVFISYSHHDISFVYHPFEQLTAREREP